MRIAEADILFVPGRSRATEEHWQRRWAERLATARWIEPAAWGAPDFEERIGGLYDQIIRATRPVVLVAHSLGVLSVAHVAMRLADAKVRGAFLVAPPDIEDAEQLPAGLRAFANVPRDPLPFPSMLVVSTNDPLCSVPRAVEFSTCWGSDLHFAGPAGHINSESGHGPWPEGLLMFTRLMQRLKE